MSKNPNLALQVSKERILNISKKSASPIRTNPLRKILLPAKTPPSTAHRLATARAAPVTGVVREVATEAAIAAAVTVAVIGKVLAAAAAEDVLDAVVVAADAAGAAAADSARAAHAIFLLPSTLLHRAANLAAAIVVETAVLIAAVATRSAVATIGDTAVASTIG